VAVHDLVIHPRERELVIGTHGRGVHVMDVAPLEQMTAHTLAAAAHLFDVKPVTLFRSHGTHGLQGAKVYAAPNPPRGAALYYHLATKADGPVRLTVRDARGKGVAELKGSPEAGLHRLNWSPRGAPEEGPGEYTAELRVGGRVLTKRFRVEADE
jgi:hypothetical protein